MTNDECRPIALTRIHGRPRRFLMVGAPTPIICRRDVKDMLVFIQAISKAPLQVHYTTQKRSWHQSILTGVDLSKIFGGQTKILGGAEGGKK